MELTRRNMIQLASAGALGLLREAPQRGAPMLAPFYLTFGGGCCFISTKTQFDAAMIDAPDHEPVLTVPAVFVERVAGSPKERPEVPWKELVLRQFPLRGYSVSAIQEIAPPGPAKPNLGALTVKCPINHMSPLAWRSFNWVANLLEACPGSRLNPDWPKLPNLISTVSLKGGTIESLIPTPPMHAIWKFPQHSGGRPPYEQALTDLTLYRSTPSQSFSIALKPLPQASNLKDATIELKLPAAALITYLPTTHATRGMNRNEIKHFPMFKSFLTNCDEKLLVPTKVKSCFGLNLFPDLDYMSVASHVVPANMAIRGMSLSDRLAFKMQIAILSHFLVNILVDDYGHCPGGRVVG